MQQKVTEFIKKHQLDCDYQTRYIDLVSEIGEIGKQILTDTNYNATKIKISNDLILEIGDGLFSLLALCHALDIDSQTALSLALEKYQHRFVQSGKISSK